MHPHMLGISEQVLQQNDMPKWVAGELVNDIL
jgi:hypothetical protein